MRLLVFQTVLFGFTLGAPRIHEPNVLSNLLKFPLKVEESTEFNPEKFHSYDEVGFHKQTAFLKHLFFSDSDIFPDFKFYLFGFFES